MLSKDLVAASAKPLILSILSSGESYGYEIILRVKELSGGKIEWKDGMLYPLLHRMQEQGLIESEWRTQDNGKRRKYYRIKEKGQKELMVEKGQWMVVNSTLGKIWGGNPCLI